MQDYATTEYTEDIDPRLLEFFARKEKLRTTPVPPIDLSTLLAPIVNVQKTPEGISVGPGTLPATIRDVQEKIMMTPAKVGQSIYNVLRDLFNKINITPSGEVLIRTSPQSAPSPLEVPPAMRQNIPRSMWQQSTATLPAPPTRPEAPREPIGPPAELASIPSRIEEDILESSLPSVPDQQAQVPAPETQAQPSVIDEQWLKNIETIAKPWEPQTDFDTELKRLFTDLLNEYKNAPSLKPEEKPKSAKEFLADFAKTLAMAISGRDVFAYKEKEKQREYAQRERERAEVLNIATQMFNSRLSALTERVRREDAERQAKAKQLEALGNLYPNIRSSPAFLAAINSIAGVPLKDTMEFIKAHTNPVTGKLENLYLSPIDQAVEQAKALHDLKVKTLKSAGFSDTDAQLAAVFGTYDPVQISLMNYKRALESGDRKEVEKAARTYQALKSASSVDPEQEAALQFISLYQTDPKAVRNHLKTLLKTDKAIDSFIAYKTALAYGAKNWKPPEEKDLSFVESKVREAATILQRNDPAEIKRFMDNTAGVHPAEVVKHALKIGDPSIPVSQEPYATIKSMFPKLTSDQLAGLLVPGNPVMDMINDVIRHSYSETFATVESKLPANKPLTATEMYKIASLLNAGKQKEALAYIQQLWAGKREGLK